MTNLKINVRLAQVDSINKNDQSVNSSVRRFGATFERTRHSVSSSLRRSADSFVFVFAAVYVAEILLHANLLRLPYFWDEAGYYIPAAYDIYNSFSLIPHSTLTNAHPPLVMLWLALWWKLFGFAPLVTRLAMLAIAAFGLTGVYRLAAQVANRGVAFASLLCVAVYPVWFAQSSLAHVDLAAASFILWGLSYFLAERRRAAVAFFTLAVLAKETALLVPVTLFAWELLTLVLAERRGAASKMEVRASGPYPATSILTKNAFAKSALLLLPCLPLALWFGFHYAKTGYIFGNPEFFRYNVSGTWHPLRLFIALLQRLWQAFGHMHLSVLTLAMLAAMLLPALREPDTSERPRIALSTQALFALLVLAHAVAFTFLGGAVLARYMLPVIPLVVITAVSTLRRRVPYWPVAVGLVAAIFVAGWWIAPPYAIAPEDNLTYVDFVRLHQQAAQQLESRHAAGHVLTAWPATDELSKPWLGYVTKPIQVTSLENFSNEQLRIAAQQPETYDTALFFSTKVEPERRLPSPAFWKKAQTEYFDAHADVPAPLAARMLGGRLSWKGRSGVEWAAIADFDRVKSAKLATDRH